jgi:hypothetical protein
VAVPKFEDADCVRSHDEEEVPVLELKEAKCVTTMRRRSLYVVRSGETVRSLWKL